MAKYGIGNAGYRRNHEKRREYNESRIFKENYQNKICYDEQNIACTNADKHGSPPDPLGVFGSFILPDHEDNSGNQRTQHNGGENRHKRARRRDGSGAGYNRARKNKGGERDAQGQGERAANKSRVATAERERSRRKVERKK